MENKLLINFVLIFSILELKKKLFEFEKLINNNSLSNKNFFSYGIEKLKRMLYSQYFPLSSVKIWLLNLDCSLSDSHLRRTVISMFNICKKETL